jgi:hypothetical protein
LELGGIVHDLRNDFPPGLVVALEFALHQDNTSLRRHQQVVNETGGIRELNANRACAVKDRLDFGNREYSRDPVNEIADERFVITPGIPAQRFNS